MYTWIYVLFLFALDQSSQFSTTTSQVLFHHRFRRQSHCKDTDFKCSNGDCISPFSRCDGSKDCSDGSDETTALCHGNVCPIRTFRCSYGACIDKDLECDGKSDCADGSDEQCGRMNTISSCSPQKFQCSSGQCIDQYSRCDGVKDCSDGSDETKELCMNFTCPLGCYRCEYGACIDRSARCNGQSDCADGSDELLCDDLPSNNTIAECVLPTHPEHGAYFSALCHMGDLRQACRNSPGTRVPKNWLLKYTCSENYDLTSTDSEYSVCENGVWKNPLDCIKLCPPLKSLSVDVRCEYNGHEVPCDKTMKPGTRATAKCKQHYKEFSCPHYSRLICQEKGHWSFPLFYCTPECGFSPKVEGTNKDLVEELATGAKSTKRGQFPWLASIFLKNESALWEQKCGGTLISTHIVMTAAHCLVFAGRPIKPDKVKVGLGKYYRNFYTVEEESHIADVREVLIQRSYSGGSLLYALDIGLLDLTVSVQVNAYIMPACVDWTSSITIAPGEIGYVAGWGKTENATSSETVLLAQLSYIDHASCVKKVRFAHQMLITQDKFCAGRYDGSQVDKGDSGGGLTFVRNGQHFVFGVVSTKMTDQRELSLFTDISNVQHHNWIEKHRDRLNMLHNDA